MKLGPEDVAVRGNFASMDGDGRITDRRAGRISTEENSRLIKILSRKIKDIEGVEVILRTVKEHRFVLVLRGKDLDGRIADTDPQETGKPVLPPEPLDPSLPTAASISPSGLKVAKEKSVSLSLQ